MSAPVTARPIHQAQQHDQAVQARRDTLAQLEQLRDLEARAAVMYANGYRASGDALMARISRIEGRA